MKSERVFPHIMNFPWPKRDISECIVEGVSNGKMLSVCHKIVCSHLHFPFSIPPTYFKTQFSNTFQTFTTLKCATLNFELGIHSLLLVTQDLGDIIQLLPWHLWRVEMQILPMKQCTSAALRWTRKNFEFPLFYFYLCEMKKRVC